MTIRAYYQTCLSNDRSTVVLVRLVKTQEVSVTKHSSYCPGCYHLSISRPLSSIEYSCRSASSFECPFDRRGPYLTTRLSHDGMTTKSKLRQHGQIGIGAARPKIAKLVSAQALPRKLCPTRCLPAIITFQLRIQRQRKRPRVDLLAALRAQRTYAAGRALVRNLVSEPRCTAQLHMALPATDVGTAVISTEQLQT